MITARMDGFQCRPCHTECSGCRSSPAVHARPREHAPVFKVGEPAASGTGKAFRSGDGFGRWSQHADQLLAVRSIARRLGWRVTRLASVPPFGRLRGRTLPRWLKHFSMAGNRRRLAALEVLPEWRTAAGISALHGEGVKEAPVRRITWSVLTAAMLVGLAGFVTQRGSTDVQLAGSFGPPWAASTRCSQCHNYS